jgi:hypothetical protein
MHWVHTLIRLTLPFMLIFIFCRLGSHLLLVNLWEWLTLCPVTGFFPQISHTFATSGSSFVCKSNCTRFINENQPVALLPGWLPDKSPG